MERYNHRSVDKPILVLAAAMALAVSTAVIGQEGLRSLSGLYVTAIVSLMLSSAVLAYVVTVLGDQQGLEVRRGWSRKGLRIDYRSVKSFKAVTTPRAFGWYSNLFRGFLPDYNSSFDALEVWLEGNKKRGYRIPTDDVVGLCAFVQQTMKRQGLSVESWPLDEYVEPHVGQRESFVSGYAQLADVYSASGRQDETVRLLQRAVLLDPNSPDLRARLILALIKAGDQDAAIQECQHLRVLDSNLANQLETAIQSGSSVSRLQG